MTDNNCSALFAALCHVCHVAIWNQVSQTLKDLWKPMNLLFTLTAGVESKFITSIERKRPTDKKQSFHWAKTLKSELRNAWLEKNTLCREGPRLDFSEAPSWLAVAIYCRLISGKCHNGVLVSNSLGAENLSHRYELASFISCYGYVKLDQSFPKGLLKLLILLFNLSGNESGQNLRRKQ